MRIPNEIKAGLVILMAAGIGAFFIIKTSSVKQETYDIKTSFTYAGDLKANAVVKLSGIEVGRLKDIDFVYDGTATRVDCVLEINSWAKVRQDSIAYIGTAGFVGDAFVGITPGESPDFAASGSVIEGEDPVEMRVLMKKADNIAQNLDKLLSDVRAVITDNRSDIDAIFGNLAATTGNLKNFTADGKLDSIMSNLEATTQNFKEFSEDVKKSPWKLLFKGE